ncbi:MAG: YceD family protein [Thermoleophilia bacterium]
MPEPVFTTIDLSQFSWSSGESRTMELELYLPPIRLADQDYPFVPQIVPATLTVTYAGRGFVTHIDFSCRLEGPCWRCLEPAGVDRVMSVEDFFEADLPPLEELSDEDEAALWYREDGLLNLSLWARDAVVEKLPPKILCDAGCQGLCAQCGANLNQVSCDCRPPADSRWDRLKDWQPE